MGWMDVFDPVVDFISPAFKAAGTGLGTAWDWGTKNQAAMGAVAGVGTGLLSYMSAKNAPVPGEADREYMEQRRREHNQGIGAANLKLKGEKVVRDAGRKSEGFASTIQRLSDQVRAKAGGG